MSTSSEYKPIHPEIFTYNEAFVNRFLHEAIRNPTNAKAIVKEVAEQLYFFQLFTAEFCQFLIEEAENANKWETNLTHTEEPHPFIEGAVDICEPDTTVSFDKLPGLEAVYGKVIDNHVRPIIEQLWITFKLQRWDTPAVRKYEPHVVKEMGLHYDLETVSMVGYLSSNFEGGGTYFPRWNCLVGDSTSVIPGSVVIYPGGVSHEHLAKPITAGKRYMLSNSFY
eukprot:TRINITY_DN25_c0_g1_i1.p1 TRINITY_DN25_c0_g1~~TRINITY_DN25_c0_g1_i1.p1  ORF type:complete len:224 (-),score=122.04 TRINITY_DN25_c0_g1_i1:51-722(-)